MRAMPDVTMDTACQGLPGADCFVNFSMRSMRFCCAAMPSSSCRSRPSRYAALLVALRRPVVCSAWAAFATCLNMARCVASAGAVHLAGARHVLSRYVVVPRRTHLALHGAAPVRRTQSRAHAWGRGSERDVAQNALVAPAHKAAHTHRACDRP